MFSGLNVDLEAQGYCPLGLGWFSVSKIPKIKELCFDYESTKKKRFEKRPNVCKWLKILSNSFGRHPGDRFKLFRSILALKLTKIQTFEISNIFGSSSSGRRPKNIEEFLSKVCRPADFTLENFKKVIFWSKSLVFEIEKVIFGVESSFKYCCDNLKWLLIKAGRFYHAGRADRVDHADRVGLINGDNINYLGNVNRLHVGFNNGDRIDYNGKSGEIKPFRAINLAKQSIVWIKCLAPFKILRSFRLLLSLKCLRKLFSLFCLDLLVCLVRLVRLFRLIHLVRLIRSIPLGFSFVDHRNLNIILSVLINSAILKP